MQSPQKISFFHIITDEKFITSSTKFNAEIFDNQTIYIGNSRPLHVNTTYFAPTLKNIHSIIKTCNANSGIVVLHGLDFIKAYIGNRLKRNVLILWRFFGAELYGRNKADFYSIKTKSFLNTQKRGLFLHLSKVLKKIDLWRKWGFQYKRELRRIKPHYILCTSEEEYSFLFKKYSHIPKLIRIPFTMRVQSLPVWEEKEPLIVIGNSRSPYNNHVDIVDIIRKSTFRKDFKYVLPLNYGNERNYSTRIIESFPKDLDVNFLVDFLPREEYNALFQRARFLVINSYRQHAFGNILMAIYMGIIVYLSKRNPIYHFLNRNSVLVFSIEDFENHIDSGNFPDGASIARQNFKNFSRLASMEDLNRFHHSILEKFISFINANEVD